MQKLYYFCCGLENFDQIDRSMNNHIFFTIVDTFYTINKVIASYKGLPQSIEKFITKCFGELLESDVIVNNASLLLTMRNNLFERDDIKVLPLLFVLLMIKCLKMIQCKDRNQ